MKSFPENSPTHDAYNNLKHDVEIYSKDHYYPTLNEAKSIICNNRDEKILLEFFFVLIRTQSSIDKYSTFILGDIFICQPELFTAEFNKLTKEEKIVIYNIVESGFRNATLKKENSINNYSSLNEKLLNLKKGMK
ncbi:MAG: hypothetical protein ABSC11_05495 [Smithella sp.]|jgi:hypothetical protein